MPENETQMRWVERNTVACERCVERFRLEPKKEEIAKWNFCPNCGRKIRWGLSAEKV